MKFREREDAVEASCLLEMLTKVLTEDVCSVCCSEVYNGIYLERIQSCKVS